MVKIRYFIYILERKRGGEGEGGGREYIYMYTYTEYVLIGINQIKI